MGVERKWGGNLHPWLNIDERSIANKYPEGKLKSTSKGELKDLKSLRGKRLSVTHVISGSPVSLPDIITYIHLNFIWIGDEDYQLAVSCQERHVQTTRLETRTKELDKCASVRVINLYAQ